MVKIKKQAPAQYTPNIKKLYPYLNSPHKVTLKNNQTLKYNLFKDVRLGAMDFLKCKSVLTSGGNTSEVKTNKYTGTKMIGIAVLHKSVEVPVFSKDDAIEISHMRR